MTCWVLSYLKIETYWGRAAPRSYVDKELWCAAHFILLKLVFAIQNILIKLKYFIISILNTNSQSTTMLEDSNIMFSLLSCCSNQVLKSKSLPLALISKPGKSGWFLVYKNNLRADLPTNKWWVAGMSGSLLSGKGWKETNLLKAFVYINLNEVDITVLNLQVRNPKPREIKSTALVSRANKWRSQHSNLSHTKYKFHWLCTRLSCLN